MNRRGFIGLLSAFAALLGVSTKKAEAVPVSYKERMFRLNGIPSERDAIDRKLYKASTKARDKFVEHMLRKCHASD